MDFHKELEEMRANYAKKPLKSLVLPIPDWMRPEDGLYSVYTEKEELIREGQIYYAYIVQANCALFSFFRTQTFLRISFIPQRKSLQKNLCL